MNAKERKKKEVARTVAAYKDLFDDPNKKASVQIVMADLTKVCHVWDGGFHPDESWMYHLSGRREVFFHITNMVNLTPELIERMVVAETELTEPRQTTYDPIRGAQRGER